MKILHIVRQFYPAIGGIESVVLNLARQQIKQGNSVRVLTLDRSFVDNKLFQSEEIFEQISIKRIPFWGSKRYPIAPSAIKHLKEYDLLHIHCVDFFVDYLVLLKAVHRKRIVLHTHGGFFHTKFWQVFKKLYFYTITRLMLAGCDKVIACSQNDYDLFRKVSPRVIQIANGVNVEGALGVAKHIEQETLIYIGRIDEHKRVDNLIRVVAVLKGRGTNVKLKIIGPDWKGIQSQLEALSAELAVNDRVLFLGKVSEQDLSRELSQAHVFVSASEYEGFGLTVVEAMASGTICVLNRIDSFVQITNNGQWGALTDFENHSEAADCLSTALSMSPAEYSAQSDRLREYARRYSWEAVAPKIFEVYREVL